MKKEIVDAVMERSKGLCENCLQNGTELHHIVSGSGKRKEHESTNSIVLLCYDCHRGTRGVHGRDGRKLDLQLKRNLQSEYLEQGKSEDGIRNLMGGKLY